MQEKLEGVKKDKIWTGKYERERERDQEKLKKIGETEKKSGEWNDDDGENRRETKRKKVEETKR